MKLRSIFAFLALAVVTLLLAACGAAGTPERIVETVVVEKEVEKEVEKVVTVEVEAEAEAEAEESILERARREGVVRVGFANENPYAFAQPDGTLSGEAVEVARAVFQELGIEEMEGVLTEFGSLIPGLQAGRFDVITAGMYVNPNRCEQVLFANPEYKIGEALVVEAGNPLDLHSYEDIANNPDVTVGTGAGYLEIDMMKSVGVSEDQIVTYPDDPAGMAALQAGQIDVWTGTRPTLLKLLQVTGDPNYELAEPFEQPVIEGEEAINYGAAAFRYEDAEFRQAFNQELQELKESGELLDLIGQFEGFDEGALPGDTRAVDICPDAYADIDEAPAEEEAMEEGAEEEAMEEEAMEEGGEMAAVEPQPGGTFERVLEEGVIRVGFANENPYAYQEADGTLTGEAVEVARAVFQELGIEEMEGVLTEFGSLIPGLQAGRFDVITAGMYVNPNRCEQVLFANPEYKIGEALVVEAGNPLDLHSYEDIANNPDLTVGTGAGYLEIDMMKSVGVSEDQIVTFPDDPAGMAGLQAGQIDVWTGTRPTLIKLLQVTDDPNYELAEPFEQPVIEGEEAINYGAAAFRYEDTDLRQAFNQELHNLKVSGELLDLIGQFEGFDEGALPGDTHAVDICPDAYADIDEAPAEEEAMEEGAEEEAMEEGGEMAAVEPKPGGAFERALEEGVIRVGFANENPYAYQQADGTLTGEAVEVARAVFQELGIEEMEGVLTEFGSLIPGLQAGRFDVITAGMYVNPNRCEQVLFADPEYKIGEALVVEAGNPLDLHSYEDIANNPDLTVGTGAGYLEIDMMKSVGVSEDQIVTFPDDPAGMAGLQAGQIDVWTGTRPTLIKLLQVTDDPNYELAEPFEQPVIEGEEAINYGAAAFRYEDDDLRQAFNQKLSELKESGELLDLIGQFEGFDEGALPGDTHAEDICPDAYTDIE